MNHRNMPILLVDDDSAGLHFLTTVLPKFGFTQLHTARTGQEALEVLGIGDGSPQTDSAGHEPVDLVLLDVMLPDMDGFEVCRMIRQRLSSFLPVIHITALTAPEDELRGVEAGADDFISKPVYANELVAKVDMLLARKQKLNALLKNESAPLQPKPGDTKTVGEYIIHDPIATGASTLTYKARHPESERWYVVKVLAHHALENEEYVQRFEREIQLMRRLKHPSIIPYIADGVDDDRPYFVMQYVTGNNLDIILKQRHPLPFTEIHRIAVDLAHGLRYLHQQGIVHRDIKPRNVLLGDSGKLWIADLGIAVSDDDLRLTQPGHAVGTPAFMAPEQFCDGAITAATDVYSYGATIYHLITNTLPLFSTDAVEIVRMHIQQTPRPLSASRANVPDEWSAFIVDGCLAKAPQSRPPSMDAVLRQLRNLCQCTF